MRLLKRVTPWQVFTLITVLLFFNQHTFGATYAGLDNISPFWGISPILAQLEHSGNFFLFGPILFSWWFFLLSAIGVSASTISTIYLYGYLFLGLLGWYTFTQKNSEKQISPYFFVVIFLGSLVPLWIFSTHLLMFMSLFVSLPWLVNPPEKTSTLIYKLFYFLLIIPMFFSSSINLSVFLSGIFLVLAYFFFNEKTLPFKKIALIGALFLLSTQLLIFLTKGPAFIFTEATVHLTTLAQSEPMQKITTDLQKSELQNASFTNAARFATGWLSLYKPNGEHVFDWAYLYRHNLLLSIAQLLALVIIIKTSYSQKKLRIWILIYALGIVLLSAWGITLIQLIPYFSELWRSASTKLWPLIFVPYLILATSAIVTLREQKRKLTLLALIGTLMFVGFPWYGTKLVTKPTTAIIPQSLVTTFSALTPNDIAIILPSPEAIYFRESIGNYYGSSLEIYFTQAKVYDGASVSKDSEQYAKLEESVKHCQLDDQIHSSHLFVYTNSRDRYCSEVFTGRICTTKDGFMHCLPTQ